MTSRTPTRPKAARRSVAALVGAPALALALAACSGLGAPGSAAVVDGEPISDRDVQTVATELAVGTGGAVTAAQVVPLMIVSGVVDDIAGEITGGSSREDARAALEANTVDDGQASVEYSDVTLDFIATNLELNAIQQNDQARAVFEERLQELDVEVNPRYGTVDEEQGLRAGIGAVSFPWLGDAEEPQG